jgi:hypothetical protein
LNSRGQPTRGGPPAWGLGGGLTIPHRKKQCVTKCHKGPRPLGRPRRRWEDNIKMDLREIGFGDVDWIHLARDRDTWRAVVNTVMNLRVP